MKKKTKKNSQFVMHSAAMLGSPAYRVLSLAGHRILACIEIEHCRHAGKDNGKLPITHENFQEFCIHDHSIGPGLREVEALGFIEITQRGLAGNADHRRPNQFRLTYLPTDGAGATNEWSKIETVREAKAIAMKARANKPTRRSKEKPHWRKMRKPLAETTSEKQEFSVAETASEAPKSPPAKTASTI
jgi:hypothetical protein